jgi:hypothetical protein
MLSHVSSFLALSCVSSNVGFFSFLCISITQVTHMTCLASLLLLVVRAPCFSQGNQFSIGEEFGSICTKKGLKHYMESSGQPNLIVHNHQSNMYHAFILNIPTYLSMHPMLLLNLYNRIHFHCFILLWHLA